LELAAKELAVKMKDVAEDQALNALAMVKEGWSGFLKQNRYYKLKAGIVGVWVLFLLVGLLIARPSSETHVDATLSARLLMRDDPEHPAYMFFNESDDTWKDAIVTVNGEWRGVISQVGGHSDFTLTPRQLVGRDGKEPPANLKARDIVLRVKTQEAVLMKDGQLTQ
jgi:hypothetical protein